MQSQLRNIERISEELNADYHQMQHFITESNWNGRSIIDQVSQEVSSLLPKRKLTGLIIDESGWVKKGENDNRSNHLLRYYRYYHNINQ